MRSLAHWHKSNIAAGGTKETTWEGPLHDFQNKKTSLHVLQVSNCVSRLTTFGKMAHTGNAATRKQSQATGFGRRNDKSSR